MQRAREYEEASWQVDEEELEGEAALAEDMHDELYCLACDKSFRTQNAMLNHERCVMPYTALLPSYVHQLPSVNNKA